ncbi:hypothetical protein EU546_00355 [Candidatus Thorarchaeota archaeon]|nr:MAG: hypothetical protein EU546_00355 [Candidatus Thorarchaeota archaeon]
MIRNLIILDNEGHALLSANFGECHSMANDEQAVSGFISALHSFSKMLAAGDLSEIQLGSLSFLLMTHREHLFAISADDDKTDVNRTKLNKIVQLFVEQCLGGRDSSGEISEVCSSFTEHLLEERILQRNCGKHDDCADCQNRHKSLPLSEMHSEIESR